ncbi:MAG: helix-turn-helix domain-containing protein [Pseudomonadota bacterium]
MLDISEVARRASVKPSALRYYEKIGLIASVSRHGLRRQYDPDVLPRLSLISLGKAAGFSLEEIAGMFRLTPEIVLPRDRIAARAADVEAEIERLQTLVRLMRHVALCPEDDHLSCPRFQKLMRVATRERAPRARRAPRPTRRAAAT